MNRARLALLMDKPSSQCIHTRPNGSGFDCCAAQLWQKPFGHVHGSLTPRPHRYRPWWVGVGSAIPPAS